VHTVMIINMVRIYYGSTVHFVVGVCKVVHRLEEQANVLWHATFGSLWWL